MRTRNFPVKRAQRRARAMGYRLDFYLDQKQRRGRQAYEPALREIERLLAGEDIAEPNEPGIHGPSRWNRHLGYLSARKT